MQREKVKTKNIKTKNLLFVLFMIGLLGAGHSNAQDTTAAAPAKVEADASVLEVTRLNQENKIDYPLSDYVMCKSKNVVRTLRYTFNPADAQCATLYTKAGSDQKVAYGKNTKTCRDVMNNIRYNLEKAGWKCRDISNAKIHEGDPAGGSL